MKVCSKCRKLLPLIKFSHSNKDKFGRANYCKICDNIRRKLYHKEHYKKDKHYMDVQEKWRKNNKTKINNWSRKRFRKIKLLVLEHYGNKCKCCGESHSEFLTIDHIRSNGAAHRRKIGKRPIYPWLYINNYPRGFRILCFNCNCAKYYSGYCPHKRSKI